MIKRIKIKLSKDNVINNQYSKNDFEEMIIISFSMSYKDRLGEISNEIKKYVIDSDSIELYGEYDEILYFLENNLEITNKKIIIGFDLEFDKGQLELIEQKFSKFNGEVYVKGNLLPVSLDTYKKTVLEIENIEKRIRSYNFSPLEMLIYVYDYVRNRIYNKEDELEATAVSRSVSSVLFGNKIVCGGFANLFKVILDRLGIKNEIVNLVENDHSGHARNIVYLIDKKYNLSLVSFFDTTFDSKKSEEDRSFLYSYKHFGRTLNEFELVDQNDGFDYLIDEKYKIFNLDYLLELEDIISNSDDKETINSISLIVNKAFLILGLDNVLLNINKKNLLDKIDILKKLISNEINLFLFVKALIVVRGAQEKENINLYRFKIEDYYEVMKNFKIFVNNENIKVLRFIFEDEKNKRI